MVGMEQEMMDMVRVAIVVSLKVVTPVLLAGLVIGLVISIFQSITQIQEQTLAMVPKILVMTIVAVAVMPWIAAKIADFTINCFALVTPV